MRLLSLFDIVFINVRIDMIVIVNVIVIVRIDMFMVVIVIVIGIVDIVLVSSDCYASVCGCYYYCYS